MKKSILCCLGALLSACQLDINTEVYLRDIKEVQADKTLPLNLSLQVEMPSEKECKAQSQNMQTALKLGFDSVEFTGCTKVEFKTFGMFKASSIITGINKGGWNPSIGANHAFSLIVLITPDSRNVFGSAKKAAFDKIKGQIKQSNKSALFDSIDFDPRFTLAINNDTRDEQNIYISGAFLDGQPVVHQTEFNFKPRNTAQMKLSDVTNASIAADELTSLLWLKSKAE